MTNSTNGHSDNTTADANNAYLDDLNLHDTQTPSAPLRSKPSITQRFSPFVKRIEFVAIIAFGLIVVIALGLLPVFHGSSQPDTQPNALPTQGNDSSLPPLGANVTNNPRVSEVPLTARPRFTPSPQPTATDATLSQQATIAQQQSAANGLANDATALGQTGSSMTVPPSQYVPNPGTSGVGAPESAAASAAAAAPANDGGDALLVQGDPAGAGGNGASPVVMTGQQAINNSNRAFTGSSQSTEYSQAVEHDALAQVEIFAGAPIQCHLDDKLVSTLPGQATGHVTKDVRSSLPILVKGKRTYPVVIPAGSIIIGRYDNNVTPGQDRILAAWDFIEMPDGRTFSLNGNAGEEPDGSTGYQATVDDHHNKMYTTVFLGALVNAASALAVPQTNSYTLSPTQIALGAGAQTTNDLVTQEVAKQMSIPPKLTTDPRDFIIRLQSIAVIEPYYQADIDAMNQAQNPSPAPDAQ